MSSLLPSIVSPANWVSTVIALMSTYHKITTLKSCKHLSIVKSDLFPGKGLQHKVLSPLNVKAQKVNSRVSKCQNEAVEGNIVGLVSLVAARQT